VESAWAAVARGRGAPAEPEAKGRCVSEVETWLQQFIPRDGLLALDVGANVGSWTCYLADRFVEVHAFEPNPQAHGELRAATVDRENVTLIETAVGGSCGQLAEFRLYQRSVHATGFARLDTSDRGEPIGELTVPCVSLDALGYPGREVDFVKIDTEGAEVAILEGAMVLLESRQPALIVEVHSLENLDRCKTILQIAGYENVRHLPHPHAGVHPGHCWLISRGGD
jgi:FkbM family methyltransferase